MATYYGGDGLPKPTTTATTSDAGNRGPTTTGIEKKVSPKKKGENSGKRHDDQSKGKGTPGTTPHREGHDKGRAAKGKMKEGKGKQMETKGGKSKPRVKKHVVK